MVHIDGVLTGMDHHLELRRMSTVITLIQLVVLVWLRRH